MECIHKFPLLRCSKCLPKKQWPKDFEACRCKKLVPKGAICGECAIFENEAFRPGGFLEQSRIMFHVLAETNGRLVG